ARTGKSNFRASKIFRASRETLLVLTALAEGEVVAAGIVARGDANVLRARGAADAVAREAADDAIARQDRDGEGDDPADRRGDPPRGPVPGRRGDRLARERDAEDQAEEDAPEGDQHPRARSVVAADRRGELLVPQEHLAPGGLR